jgi:8-oxo-dGTP diphosphatase
MHVPHALYSQILQVMPIPCVDLLVSDRQGRVLLLLRKNEPAAGNWWFPGGRILFGERRAEAARRKLLEECGLAASALAELATFDLLFEPNGGPRIHSVTTLFAAPVDSADALRLDEQSVDALWLEPGQWLQRELHPFVRAGLGQHLSDTAGRNEAQTACADVR